ncbi:hypothetical protein QTP88_009236 [Uroleucon formosanum]
MATISAGLRPHSPDHNTPARPVSTIIIIVLSDETVHDREGGVPTMCTMRILYNVYCIPMVTTTVQTTLMCTRSTAVANYYYRTRVKIRENSWRDDRCTMGKYLSGLTCNREIETYEYISKIINDIHYFFDNISVTIKLKIKTQLMTIDRYFRKIMVNNVTTAAIMGLGYSVAYQIGPTAVLKGLELT